MDTLSYKTVSANKETVNKEWVVVDATNQKLGRFASAVAKILRGKNKVNFTPHVDCGDNVIVLNADKIVLTGAKWTDREYTTYSGYPGGQKKYSPQDIYEKDPARLIHMAVKGMIPRNKLGNKILKNLHVYTGSEHGHEAQKPKTININEIK